MAELPATHKRTHDVAPSTVFADFMKSGWAPSPLTGITAAEVAPWCVARRNALSAAFPGIRLVIPAGTLKARNADCDYRFRPQTAFAYYTGVQGDEATPDAVFIMEPNGVGHQPLLYIHPRSSRETDAFYRDARYGELWVGRRFTLDEAQVRYEIQTHTLDSLDDLLNDKKESLVLRTHDASLDLKIDTHQREEEFTAFVSAQRLIKDEYEISEMQAACDSTERGFADIVRALPAAVSTPRGERVVEAAFFGRARIEGNDVGYTTISAAG
ncbi:MAG: aminopeptidase P family protein, partial [Actinobacteria bacterium]|nr:aminopeptidase P family protein [Actinomycetota bacterium]